MTFFLACFRSAKTTTYRHFPKLAFLERTIINNLRQKGIPLLWLCFLGARPLGRLGFDLLIACPRQAGDDPEVVG